MLSVDTVAVYVAVGDVDDISFCCYYHCWKLQLQCMLLEYAVNSVTTSDVFINVTGENVSSVGTVSSYYTVSDVIWYNIKYFISMLET